MSQEYTSEKTCPICGSTDVRVFLELSQVPVHCNLLWQARHEALSAPKANIHLGFCHNCGHIFNVAFNPDLMEYTQSYENSLHFSPRFQGYATSLANQLIERYSLYDKDIIEIGCGKGEFLTLLCELGENRGTGFDPSFAHTSGDHTNSDRIRFVRDFYSDRYAHHKADLIICRHALEHIHKPTDFLTMLRRIIGGRLSMVVVFEVPNAHYTLCDLGIWDIIYEHYSYFSNRSLGRAFSVCGFSVCSLYEAYEGQFLRIDALPSEDSENITFFANEGLKNIVDQVSVFVRRYQNKVDNWRFNLEHIEHEGKRAVVWGAGSKGVTFLNTLKVRDQIEYVVDINPRKHGMYVAGTGQRIVPPEFLRKYQPNVVIVMNSIYKSEILEITNDLGLKVELLFP